MGPSTQPHRRSVIAVVVALVLLAAGFLVAAGVSGPLGAGVTELWPSRPAELDRGRDVALAWCARALLALSIAWIVIGMLSARTRLVRRPGAAAARASWVSATRPWRASESMLGMLPADRVLLVSVPIALLLATRAVQSSVFSWTQLAVVFAAWAAFLAVVLLLARRRSVWPVIAAVGGVVVLRCTVALVPLSLSGPAGSWSALWTDPVQRSAYLTLSVALFFWMFVAAGWVLSLQWGRGRAWGIVLAGIGAALAVAAAVIAVLFGIPAPV